MMLIFFDLANLLTCLLLIILLLKYKFIPQWIGFIFIVQSFTPYFLNDFLFPASFMSDQFRYQNMVSELRSFSLSYDDNYKVTITGWLLSLVPLPFIETVKSLGFYNRFLYMLVFVWLYRKSFLSGIPLYILLFYPSLLLYTSLSLRDPLIIFIMIISVVFLIDGKYFKSFLIISPLFLLKFQNFFLVLVLYFLTLIYREKTLLYRNRYIIIIFTIILILPFLTDIITLLDFYRAAMYREDEGDMEDYIHINNITDFIILGLTTVPYFIFKPLLWEAHNTLQIIQSFENIFLFIFLFIFSKYAYIESKIITTKWIVFLILSFLLYGLVVYNFGTAARYKVPFYTIYFIGLSYELYKVKGFKFGKIKK
jgi:hypothetical protein